MLLGIIYINVTIALTENSFMLYYALYVVQELNGTAYEGIFGIVLISFSSSETVVLIIQPAKYAGK